MKKATMLTLTMAASLFAVTVDPATALVGNRYNKSSNRAEHGSPKATRHSWPGVKAP